MIVALWVAAAGLFMAGLAANDDARTGRAILLWGLALAFLVMALLADQQPAPVPMGPDAPY